MSVHSYKGGTGKTLIAANLATLFAAKGKKTCLLDMDFLAPSLHSLLKTDEPDHWLNDYLNGACMIDRVLKEFYDEGLKKGKLFVGFANPSTEAIREMSAKDRRWDMQALARLLSLRQCLLGELSFDYLILDTSPGLQFSSINAIAAADIALVVATLDASDLEGTLQMLHDLYGHFDKKTAVILNKISPNMPPSERMKRIQNIFSPLKLVFNSNIACSCDIALSEKPCLCACEKQSHPFSGTLQEITSIIATHQP